MIPPNRYRIGSDARALVVRGVADDERDERAEQQQHRVRVAEPGPAQQERGAEPQPAGGPDRPGQVPRAVDALVPAVGGRDRLGARPDGVAQHPERPHELEPVAPVAPLVEQHHREHGGQDRGQRGQQGGAHAFASRTASIVVHDRVGMGLDEHEQQAIQQPGRGVVQLPDGDSVHPAPTGDEPQLGQERPPGRDEHRDAGPERDPLPPHPLTEQRREVDGLRLGVVPRRAGAVEVAHERLREPPARVTEGLALGLRDDGPEVGPVALDLAVAPAVGRVRAGRSSRRRRPGRRWRRCGAWPRGAPAPVARTDGARRAS